LLLLSLVLLPALASAADHFNLARIAVTGSKRYREEDLVRATGLTVNTQSHPTDLQNAANRLATAALSCPFSFYLSLWAQKGVEAEFSGDQTRKSIFPRYLKILSGSVNRICERHCIRQSRF